MFNLWYCFISVGIPERTPSIRSSKPPKKEIEVVTEATLSDFHNQYVDLCLWNPKSDFFATASTDRNVFLWNCQQEFKDAKSVHAQKLNVEEDSVSCLDWAQSGKHLVLGKLGKDIRDHATSFKRWRLERFV